ncbi:outer membrane protein assembly factor [Tamlana sp. s12]|uniref:POTRA domain-containing protein n=1 Tax=Tamlana sp. s12 TaxID=1630406 RepID=UPI0007FEC280|nr:POTRA domain-containing protein [Tamlana sp. s12]OBQ56020.1 surface antigen (D15) [Tamlana sp. s12]QQY83473.1 outer membrane protein assembly factor [Tamlana sp. s12]
MLFSLNGFAQNLGLKVYGKSDSESSIIENLNYTSFHKNYRSVKSEVDSIQNTLLKMGYIEKELKFIKKINDSTFESAIHLKNKIDTIYIYHNKKEINTSKISHVFKIINDTCFAVTLPNLENTLSYINSENAKKGFPFANLKLSNIVKRDSTSLKAHLILDTSKKKRTIDHIIIKGYEKFPKSYLKHFLKIKPGQTFDLNQIKSKTEQLNNLNFARETKSPEVLFSKDSTSLYLYLEKTQSNTFDGFIGFGTNEDTNKLEFDGYLNLNLINNLNFGEAFRILYKSDENDQRTFETNLSLPYLFKTPIGVELMLRLFKKDSSFTTANQSVKLHYQINAKNKTFAGIASTESNNLLSENTASLISDYSTFNYTLGYEFTSSRTMNILFPWNSKIYTDVSLGNRKTSTSQENQTLALLDAFKIFNLNQKNSIFLRVNGGALISNTYYENELLRFGGINSIRGFEENSIYASLYGVINNEYRFQLSNTIYINSIIDAAYYENKITNIHQKLYGFGFGFGLLTKAGLFKFNYALGKTENENAKLSNSKIHLSLIANF